MRKILLSSIGILVVLSLGVVLFRNWFLRTALETAVTGLTGFKTKIESLRYDLPAALQISGLKIHNPHGFKNEIFASVPEIYIDWDLGELPKRKIHIREIRLHIREIHIEKNSEGITNVSQLSSAGGTAEKTKEIPSEKSAPSEGRALPFLLDRLELTLRRVSFEDRSGGVARAALPDKISADMKVERQIFENIQDPQALVNLILLKIVYGTTFGNLLGLRPENLQDALAGAFGSGRKALGETGELVIQKSEALFTEAAGTASRGAQEFLSSKPLNGAKNTLTETTKDVQGRIFGFVKKMKSDLR